MIITKTPLRVSFIGGGSDFEDFFSNRLGYVLGTTITKYVFVFLHPLPPFAPENFRFTYRVTESVSSASEFKHPVMRQTLPLFDWEEPTNFATMSDMPGSSGLGSSSSFAVGLINAIHHSKNIHLSEDNLAQLAIKVERKLIGEPGGYQDQYHAAFGGLRLYEFKSHEKVNANRIANDTFVKMLSNSMFLIPLGSKRDSSIYASKTMASIKDNSNFAKVEEIAQTAKNVGNSINKTSNPEEALRILADGINIGWRLKSEIGQEQQSISDLIEKLKNFGALAGKLCGAGGSGFLFILVDPKRKEEFVVRAKDYNPFPVGIENRGSHLLLSS